MKQKPVIVFLYTEIAAYINACWTELQNLAEVHVVRYPVNKEAPFIFNSISGICFYERKDYSFEQLFELIKKINPDIIFCAGWIDKDYLKLCNRFSGTIPTVLCMDTQWHGTVKQHIARLLAPFTIKKYFSDVWVPGNNQYNYALRLGFKKHKIKRGYYCADTPVFTSFYKANKEKKSQHFPHRFLYVGRYYDFKGITDLWQAFIELDKTHPNDWELWCLGTGDLTPAEHPRIKHFGFVQPSDMEKYISETGVFVLPSRFEPWAVVTHEFACAGFPLLLSNAVGSAEMFLNEGKNGYLFKAGDINDLKEKLHTFIKLKDESLNLMMENSASAGELLNPEKWAQTALNFLKNEK